MTPSPSADDDIAPLPVVPAVNQRLVPKCDSCASPTKHCKDPDYAYLDSAECLNYTKKEEVKK